MTSLLWRWWESTRCVRRPGEEVETRRRGERDVRGSGVVRVRQRSGACPVLGRGEGVKDVWHDRGRPGFRQETVICKRRKVHRSKDRQHRVAGLARARESVIEAAAARSRRCDHQAIEGRATALVLVEAVTNELTEEACALGVAKADDTLHQRRVLAQRR